MSQIMITTEGFIRLLTSTEGLQFFSLIFLLNGLVIEILAVIIILSVDYTKLKIYLNMIFSFPRVEQAEQLWEEIHEGKIDFRKAPGLNSHNDTKALELKNEKQKMLLSDIIFPNKRDATVNSVELVAKKDDPKLSEISLKVQTNEYDNLQVDDSQLEKWYNNEIDKVYYRYGGLLVIGGFSVMLVSAVLELLAFLL